MDNIWVKLLFMTPIKILPEENGQRHVTEQAGPRCKQRHGYMNENIFMRIFSLVSALI